MVGYIRICNKTLRFNYTQYFIKHVNKEASIVDDPTSPLPDESRRFAALLNHLFDTHLTPRGRPYTLTEVSEATGLSVPYLSMLRKGTINNVPFDRVAKIAKFFKVPLDYFSLSEPPNERDMAPVGVADAEARALLRAGDVGPMERAVILQMIEQAKDILASIESRVSVQSWSSRAGAADTGAAVDGPDEGAPDARSEGGAGAL